MMFELIANIIIMFHSTEHDTTLDLSHIGAHPQPLTEIDALVILNSDVSHTLMDFFVANARQIILCDGAANLFYRSKHRNAANIRAIVGDLDSIEPEVRGYYSTHIEIRDLSKEQNSNDFEKGLAMAVQLENKRIVCLGVLGGRFDQEMCNLSVLQQYAIRHMNSDFLATGKTTVITVIKPQTRTTIKIGKAFAKKHVGLVCYGRAKVETKGLKWNLGQGGPQELQWGELVSSSNEIGGDEVTIVTNHPLFFSVELQQSNEKSECNTQLL